MSVLYHGEIPDQQSSAKVHPSKGASQFKAPLRLPSGVQSGQSPAQGQRYATPGSISSKGASQFKTPLRPQPGVQSGQLPAQNRPYSTPGVRPHNGALFTNPSHPIVQQLEKRTEQSGYHPPSAMPLSHDALQHYGPTTSHPRVPAFPSVVARNTYSAGDPITQKTGVLNIYPKSVSTDPYVGIPAPLSSLEALRQQRRSSQFLRESDRTWQPALPRTQAWAKSEALHRTKTHIAMKLILMAGTVLLVGGIASFLLLRSPTYLVVTWAILIIVFSNLVSRELRSYYRLTHTTPHMTEAHPSPISYDGDMGLNPILKDMTDTTGYLKALCHVFKDDQSAQIVPPEKVHRA